MESKDMERALNGGHGGPYRDGQPEEQEGRSQASGPGFGELARCDMVIRALQETKWFGCGAYKVSDSVVLASGRCTPREGECIQRGEGVALVLRGQALAALEVFFL